MKTYNQEDSCLRAQKRIKKIKGFYIHLVVYLVINVLLVATNTLEYGWNGFKSTVLSTSLFWGIGLFFHWYATFGKHILFSKEWEKRKIQEILDQDRDF